MNPTTADNLDRLIALISSHLNISPVGGPPRQFQVTLTRIRNREPEVLIQLLAINNSKIQLASSAVLNDLLHDRDPLIRQNVVRFLLSTSATSYLKPFIAYLQQNHQPEEIRATARITSNIACKGPFLTSACVQHNAILSWRLISLLINLR